MMMMIIIILEILWIGNILDNENIGNVFCT